MPIDADGFRADMIIDPVSVFNRMNPNFVGRYISDSVYAYNPLTVETLWVNPVRTYSNVGMCNDQSGLIARCSAISVW